MSTSYEQTSTRETSIADDLQLVCDDVDEFHHCCAMLCDTFPGTAHDGNGLDSSASAQTLSCWMKERMERLSQELKRIQRKADARARAGSN